MTRRLDLDWFKLLFWLCAIGLCLFFWAEVAKWVLP